MFKHLKATLSEAVPSPPLRAPPVAPSQPRDVADFANICGVQGLGFGFSEHRIPQHRSLDRRPVADPACACHHLRGTCTLIPPVFCSTRMCSRAHKVRLDSPRPALIACALDFPALPGPDNHRIHDAVGRGRCGRGCGRRAARSDRRSTKGMYSSLPPRKSNGEMHPCSCSFICTTVCGK
jgi:hypothetical protein